MRGLIILFTLNYISSQVIESFCCAGIANALARRTILSKENALLDVKGGGGGVGGVNAISIVSDTTQLPLMKQTFSSVDPGEPLAWLVSNQEPPRWWKTCDHTHTPAAVDVKYT